MRIYHWFVVAYTLVSVLALIAIPLSAAGCITPDPLSAVPAILLGLPWSHLLLWLGNTDAVTINFGLVAAAMAINGCLLWLLGRVVSRLWRQAHLLNQSVHFCSWCKLRHFCAIPLPSIAADKEVLVVMRHASPIAPVFASVLFAFSAAPAFAENEIRTEQVHFKRGASSATIEGKIRGYETVDYVLEASKGQDMNVSMATDNGGSYFNILAPGENEVAMFIGSTSGNQFEGTLPKSGDYKIRVYMMRSAARRNETAKYRLEMIITGAAEKTSTTAPSSDALVKGTDFHATGNIPCTVAVSQSTASCPFGVKREANGSGIVTITKPDGRTRAIFFEDGKAVGADVSEADPGDFKAEKQGDLSIVRIGRERYEIPDAVIFGG
jgi:hypothetical protein